MDDLEAMELELFRAEAARRGMTLGAWAKEAGIILPHRAQEIERREVHDKPDGDYAMRHCPACRRRAGMRREP